MAAVTDAFKAVYPDGPATSPVEPLKSEIRNIGVTIDSELDSVRGLAVAGAQWKTDGVRAGSLTNVTASTLTAGASFQGLTLATGDRIALMGQTSGAASGLFAVQASGSPVRTSDADTAAEVLGMAFLVLEGTLAGKGYIMNTPGPITLGTTPLTFAPITAAQAIQFATEAVAIAGQLANQSMSPATNKAVLEDRIPGFRSKVIERPGSVLAIVDRTGRLIADFRQDGKGYVSGREIVTKPAVQGDLEVRQRGYVGFNGDSNSLNDIGGEDDLGVTFFPAFQLMPNTGPETFAGSSDGANPATKVVGFNPGIVRERSSVPVLRAMTNGVLAGERLIVDLPGRSGSNGQLSSIGVGSTAYIAKLANIQTAYNKSVAGGKTMGIAAMFFQGGDQDWRASLTADQYINAFRSGLDTPERAALQYMTYENPFPRFIRQISTHGYWASDYAREVVVALGRMGQLPNNFVVGPTYLCEHADGATVSGGWADAYLLSAHGNRHMGLMEGKAYRRWAKNKTWRPCEMISARIYGPRLIELLVHVPKPPLQFYGGTVAALGQPGQGLEVWVGTTRMAISSVAITDDGSDTGVGRINIMLSSDLNTPINPVEIWAARTSDIVGTVSGAYRIGCQPGPLTGPRTRICDSDSVAGEAWAFQLLDRFGKPYDARNYLTVGKVIAT